ncbi:MAG: hypothetical protein KGL35_20595 [Bradyrhizobium sp.]|nr:hypothetical protein [Bradyrhizobium sp.]
MLFKEERIVEISQRLHSAVCIDEMHLRAMLQQLPKEVAEKYYAGRRDEVELLKIDF